MSIENFLLILFSSLPGTILMTATMYLYGRSQNADTRVIHVFGSMLSGATNERHSRKKVVTVGTIGHFSAGFVFAIAYFLLWNWGVFEIRIFDTILLGALSGILAIGAWSFYFNMHAVPPRLSRKHYFIALFIAHIVFAAGTVYPFHLIQPSPEFYFELAK